MSLRHGEDACKESRRKTPLTLLGADVLVDPGVAVDDAEPFVDQPCRLGIAPPLIHPLVDPGGRLDLPNDDVVRAAEPPRAPDSEPQ